MDKVKLNRSNNPKEIYVRVMSLASKKNTEFDISRLKEEYDREGGKIRNWNVFSGGGIGVSVGLIACLATTAVGVPISMPEVFTLVCGSLLFGIIAGFILY
jgi:hypothetical protein